jgi:hypothetical protein
MVLLPSEALDVENQPRVLNKKPSELTKALRVVIRVHLLVSLSIPTNTLSGVIDEGFLGAGAIAPQTASKYCLY